MNERWEREHESHESARTNATDHWVGTPAIVDGPGDVGGPWSVVWIERDVAYACLRRFGICCWKDLRRVREVVVKSGIRPVGFEPTTYGLEVRCSIQLSYGRLMQRY